MPKQLTNENGVIPYQLHEHELKVILNNASVYLPFLNNKDENELTIAEKIIKLFNFRIPYYVGPLFNDGNNERAWAVRKEDGRVYPWNFEEKIDVKKSAEEFISRMVKKCTYLTSENCLPKESILYEKFKVLNELNNLRINGERIDTNTKQLIYTDLFRSSGKKISKAKLEEFLKIRKIIDKKEKAVLSGFDSELGGFTNYLSSYQKFKEIFGVDVLTDSQISAAEEIIKWSTIYGESRKFLLEKIRENYGPDSSKPRSARKTCCSSGSISEISASI